MLCAKSLVNLCLQGSCTSMPVNHCKIWISLILAQFRQFSFIPLSLAYLKFLILGKTLEVVWYKVLVAKFCKID